MTHKQPAQHLADDLTKSQRNALRMLLCSVTGRADLRRALKLPTIAIRAVNVPAKPRLKL